MLQSLGIHEQSGAKTLQVAATSKEVKEFDLDVCVSSYFG